MAISQKDVDDIYKKHSKHTHVDDGKGHCKKCGKSMPQHAIKVKGKVPKTKRGKEMVAKLGRKKKTGGFSKIAAKASKEYGSKKAGEKVAAAIFWKKVKHN